MSSEQTRLDRHPERGYHDRETIDRILDAHWLCHVAFTDALGPHVIPTIYWRDGDYVYIHGARQSRMMLTLASGAPVCINVTLIDGLVFARRAFNHSANYRSVNVYGCFSEVVDDAEKQQGFDQFFDNVLPGRREQVIAPDHKERAATMLLRIALNNAVAKIREGGPSATEKNDPDCAIHHCWTGVLPLQLTHSTPWPSQHSLSPALMARVTGSATTEIELNEVTV